MVSVQHERFKYVYQCENASGCDTNPVALSEWISLGSCFGTLPFLGGCPAPFVPLNPYDEHNKVSKAGLVYQCKANPPGLHCKQAGFEPGSSVGSGPQMTEYWKNAWEVLGYCFGTVSSTTSPNCMDIASSVGVCPPGEWNRGSNVAYEEGDMISVTVSNSPLCKVAYVCKGWPFSGFCGQFSPTESGGDQGWTLAGGCDENIGPTASPSFDSIKKITGGCPVKWSDSTTNYKSGALVSYDVSTNPDRTLVFQCREWPHTGFCNQGIGYEPTTKLSSMAWILKGYCLPLLGQDYCTWSPDYTCYRSGWPACCGGVNGGGDCLYM